MTSAMELRLTGAEADGRPARHFCSRAHKSPLLIATPSQINPIVTLLSFGCLSGS